MRKRDQKKEDAVFDATVALVNEIGFVAASVSKIAARAGVSPATIYIYHKNKEALLISVYLRIKRDMSSALLDGFDSELPIFDILKGLWYRLFGFIARHPHLVNYSEQFANSPFSTLVDRDSVDSYFDPILKVLQQGIAEKIIKDVPSDILAAFIFYPVLSLANPGRCAGFVPDNANIETAFSLAWDAIRR